MAGRNDTPAASSAPPVKDLIVERRKKKKSSSSTKKHAAAAAIEGYTPQTGRRRPPQPEHLPANDAPGGRKTVTFADTPTQPKADDEPMVFSSLADMMQAAGTLPDPSEPVDPATAVIEADLQFSCMAPEDYEALQTEAAMEQERVFLGLRPPDENTTPEYLLEEGSSRGDLWDVLGGDDSEDEQDDDEPENATPPRSFLKLWTALSQWVTPQAVHYVQSIRNGKEDAEASLQPVPKTDIEASRCAALMSLLKRHVAGRNDTQHHAMHEATKLGNLLRCFDYAQPSPDLDGAHARALAWILLETVAAEPNSQELPQVCSDLGFVPEEYKYLVESGISNFGSNNSST